jgi:hypothetical protein
VTLKSFGTAVICACLAAAPAWAQKYKGDITLSLQPGLGVAVGSFSNNYDIAVEGGGQVDFAVADGTAVGIRASYRMFNNTAESRLKQMKIAQFGVQGKRLFNPESRLGTFGVLGGGIYWHKVLGPDLSQPDFGGFAGLGVHYESSDRLAVFAETVYNTFLSEPTTTGYFSFSVGITIGLSEE